MRYIDSEHISANPMAEEILSHIIAIYCIKYLLHEAVLNHIFKYFPNSSSLADIVFPVLEMAIRGSSFPDTSEL